MRLGLLTSTWRRPEITRLVLRYYAALEIRNVEFVRVAVTSPEDPEPTGPVAGWMRAFAPNDPLGRKWNIGMQTLRRYDPDAVIIVGSDDLLNDEYFRRIRMLVSKKHEFIELEGLHFFDVGSGECIYALSKRIGAGRCLSRSLLERADWTCWEHDVNIGLDGSMYRRLGMPGVAVRKIQLPPAAPLCGRTLVDTKMSGIVCVDLKSRRADGSRANIWSFEEMRTRLTCEPVDGATLLKSEFPAVAEYLLEAA